MWHSYYSTTTTTTSGGLGPKAAKGATSCPARARDAKDFLQNELAGGRVASNEVYERATAAGISKATLWRAKGELGVRAQKRGGGGWYWSLSE